MPGPPTCNQTLQSQLDLEAPFSPLGVTNNILNDTFDTLCNVRDYHYVNETFVTNYLMQACYFGCQMCPNLLHTVSGKKRIDYLNGIMGNNRYDNGIPLSIIIGLLCVFGTVANLLTIIVIKRNKVLQATSRYLLSIAVSDMLILACTGPLEIKLHLSAWPWYAPQFFCRFHPYLKDACTFTTVLHIVAFTIERYIVICYPMRAKTILSSSRETKIICAIWVIAFVCASPNFAWHAVFEVCPGITQSRHCSSSPDMDAKLDVYYTLTTVILFVIPMTLIIVLYAMIARTLYAKNIMITRRTSMVKNSNRRIYTNVARNQRDEQRDAVERARHQAVKLLALIAICFFILWFPYHLIRSVPLFFPLENWKDNFIRIYGSWFYPISIVLLYLSSVSNPVLYNVMSARFRKAFQRTIFCQEVRGHQIEYNTCMTSTKIIKNETFSNASTHITSF